MAKISFFLKLISFFILVFTWAFTILNFGNLPEIIPVHYNFAGNPDGFGSKHLMWLLNGLMTGMFLILLYLSKRPNSPWLNIPQNLKAKPVTTELVVAVLMFLIMLLFGNISCGSVLSGLGKTDGISTATNYILGLIFLFIIGMMLYSWRLTQMKNRSSEL